MSAENVVTLVLQSINAIIQKLTSGLQGRYSRSLTVGGIELVEDSLYLCLRCHATFNQFRKLSREQLGLRLPILYRHIVASTDSLASLVIQVVKRLPCIRQLVTRLRKALKMRKRRVSRKNSAASRRGGIASEVSHLLLDSRILRHIQVRI